MSKHPITHRTGITIDSLIEPQSVQAPRKTKNIEFLYFIVPEYKMFDQNTISPSHFSNIILLRKGIKEGEDLMWAYSGDPQSGCLYLGNWNDGTF